MTELLPCPFCGSPPLKSRAGETFILHCGNADCDVKCEVASASPDGVIEYWNKRGAPIPAQAAGTQEPVAWRYRFSVEPWTYSKTKPDGDGVHYFEVQPLYAAPVTVAQGAQDQEALQAAWAEGYEFGLNSRDKTPGDIEPILKDPVAVHINMLRGSIAKPSWAAIKHLYPEHFQPEASQHTEGQSAPLLLDAAGLRALADEIEQSDGLMTMQPIGPIQLGIKRTAATISALRVAASATERTS